MTTRSGLIYYKKKKNVKYFKSIQELAEARPQLFDPTPSLFRTERPVLESNSGFADIILRIPVASAEHRDLLIHKTYNWILKKYPIARYQTVLVSPSNVCLRVFHSLFFFL